jgi:hypothetical protein
MVCQATTEKTACQAAVDHQEKMVCQVAADHQEKMAKTASRVIADHQD